MDHDLIPLVAILSIFVGLPWMIFHYITQWKKNGQLPVEDEKLLDELHDLARRLDDRLRTIERIIAVDDPNFAARVRLADERSDETLATERLEERLRAR
jgi:phage shock protein B